MLLAYIVDRGFLHNYLYSRFYESRGVVIDNMNNLYSTIKLKKIYVLTYGTVPMQPSII